MNNLQVMVIVCAAAIAGGANAATYDVAWTASGFPAYAPIDPVVGSFTVTGDFDNDINTTADGISNFSANIPVDSPIVFQYNVLSDYFSIGVDPFYILFGGTNDFNLDIDDFTTPESGFEYFSYVTADSTSPNTNLARFVEVSVSPAAIPLPAPILLLGSALLGLCAMTRRSRWRVNQA